MVRQRNDRAPGGAFEGLNNKINTSNSEAYAHGLVRGSAGGASTSAASLQRAASPSELRWMRYTAFAPSAASGPPSQSYTTPRLSADEGEYDMAPQPSATAGVAQSTVPSRAAPQPQRAITPTRASTYSSLHSATLQRSRSPSRAVLEDERSALFEQLHKGSSPFFLRADRELNRWYAGVPLPAAAPEPSPPELPRPGVTTWPANEAKRSPRRASPNWERPEDEEYLPHAHHYDPEDLPAQPDYQTLRMHAARYNDAAYSQVGWPPTAGLCASRFTRLIC